MEGMGVECGTFRIITPGVGVQAMGLQAHRRAPRAPEGVEGAEEEADGAALLPGVGRVESHEVVCGKCGREGGGAGSEGVNKKHIYSMEVQESCPTVGGGREGRKGAGKINMEKRDLQRQQVPGAANRQGNRTEKNSAARAQPPRIAAHAPQVNQRTSSPLLAWRGSTPTRTGRRSNTNGSLPSFTMTCGGRG